MLKTIDIQNVALIKNLSLEFSPNFNVLSGETGAGKSIIIDSLNFVIGSKTSKTLIKQGEKFMKVTALFEPPFNENVPKILEELGIDYESQLVLSRKMTVDNKSEMRVNGEIVTSNNFKRISTFLVDIHGQHEHQKILMDKYHLEILDSFIQNNLTFSKFENEYNTLKEIEKEISSLNGSTQNQERMLDLLQYQIKEIEDADIKENEDEDLSKRKLLMQNSEKIFDSLSQAYSVLEGQESVSGAFKRASNLIMSLTKFDESFSNIAQRLESLKFDTMDVINTIKDKKDECDFNSFEFEEVDTRLDKIKQLKKKYGPTLQDVFKFLEKAKNDYDNILNSKDLLLKKLNEKDEVLNNILDLGLKISEIRRKTAQKFESRTNKELAELGMKNAIFHIDFKEFPTKENLENRLTSKGLDKIEFLFSANAGQNLKPISEIISGGEASRFMLALKNILAEYDDINLMVFDEVDTGISGEMGYKVAQKLANISRQHQVISVSHLPQICAMADRNIFIEKNVVNNDTVVSSKILNDTGVLSEIARLSGGVSDSDVSLKHASELKNRCNEYKNKID